MIVGGEYPWKVHLRSADGTLSVFALVDDIDYRWVRDCVWHTDPQGYVKRGGGNAGELLHRDVMRCERGDGLVVDHRNGDKLDNRRSNLRITTHVGNGANRANANANNASGYRGVHFSARRQRWVAQAKTARKGCVLGEFPTAEEAALAAARYRLKHMPTSDTERVLIAQILATDAYQEARVRAQKRVDQLSARERKIVELLHLGWKSRQIAEAVGLSRSAIDNRIHRMRSEGLGLPYRTAAREDQR